jgi:putative ABC transport system permease protein
VSEQSGGVAPVLTPVVRARLAAVDGRPITRTGVETRQRRDADGAWYFTREYVLTWSEAPPAGALSRGRWWTPAEAAARPRVSVEEGAARHLGVDVGSRLTFDIQGVSVEADVMSLRKVDWQSFTTNFFMILSPGALDGAPAVYVAAARVPAALERGLQDQIVAAFPNVTAIPLRDVLGRVAGVLGDIAVAVRLIALFTLGTGVVVLVGSLASTRYQRLYESVVLRALGATRGAVARTFAVEYACLGATAGVGGTALAALLAWMVLQFVLDVPWAPGLGPWLLGPVVTVAVAVLVGFLTTFRLLGERPLAVLRQE